MDSAFNRKVPVLFELAMTMLMTPTQIKGGVYAKQPKAHFKALPCMVFL